MVTPKEPPRIGVLLPTREQAITGTYAAAPLLEFARQAELLGFDSLWTGDSLMARPRFDPVVMLAAAGAVTNRITLGTAALTPALRHPLIAANMIASLDHVSGTRLVLGLGGGFPIPETEKEFAAVGASFRGRAGRLDETVALWRQAWNSGEPSAPADFAGRYWTADGLNRLPRPLRPGGPPLWLAGSDTPNVLRRVARHYDGWLPYLPSASAYRQAWQQILANAEQAGRPARSITAGLYATITINQDQATARAELEHYVQHYYGRSLDIVSTVQAYRWGSVEYCVEWLAGYISAGAQHIVIRIGSLDPQSQLKDIADFVLPALRVLA